MSLRHRLTAFVCALALPAAALAGEPPAAATGAGPTAANAPPAAEQRRDEVLEDGIGLSVATLPEARAGSLRIVVKAGSRQDPAGKEGLAHLVAHLIFQQMPAREPLLDDVRAAGGAVDVRVSAEAATFVLDSPAEQFAKLAARFVALVTDPSLEKSQLERENGALATEPEVAPDRAAITRYLEEALFTQESRPIVGTSESRAAIEQKDVVEFFNRHYTSQTVAFVFSGPLRFEEARAVLDGAVRIPPTMAEEVVRDRPRKPLPALPFSQQQGAPAVLTVHGYLLEDQDAQVCDQLADLVGLRLKLAIKTVGSPSGGLDVQCARLHGNQILFATARSDALVAKDLPKQIAAVFGKARKLKLSSSEKRVLEQRQSNRGWRGASSPAAIADRLADETVRGPSAATSADAATPSLESAAARTFVESRQLVLELSPAGR